MSATPFPAVPRSTYRAPSFARHSRKCVICHHPEREAIEEHFVHWQSPRSISNTFGLRDSFSIYRHARAAGLYRLRRANLRSVLENLLERAASIEPTAAAIVKAVRAYACLTDSGEWVEPATRVEVSSAAPRPSRPRNRPRGARAHRGVSAPPPGVLRGFLPHRELPRIPAVSNRNAAGLGSRVNFRKERTDAIPNRKE